MKAAREVILTDAQLLALAEEGLSAALHAVTALRGPSLPAEFRTPLTIEAFETATTAMAALAGLQCRAIGMKPPKLGD
jgi:hypothetical protein